MPLKKVLIVGSEIDVTPEMARIYSEADCLIIKQKDEGLLSEEDITTELRAKGGIDSGTKITIYAHGGVENGKHSIQILDGEDGSTRRLFKILSDEAKGNPLNINLYSCFGGAAATDTEVLPLGSTCVFHAPSDEIIWIENADRATVAHARADTGDVVSDLFRGAPYEMHNFTVAVRLKDGEVRSVSLRPPRKGLYQAENIAKFISEQWGDELRTTFDGIEESNLPDNLRIESIPTEAEIKANFTEKLDEYVLSLLYTEYLDKSDIAGTKLSEFLKHKKEENPRKLQEFLKLKIGEDSILELYRKSPTHIEILINAGARFDESENDRKLGASLLISAIKDNNIIALEKLLEAGAKADEKDEYGKTALEYAIDVGNVKVFQLLLEKLPEEKVLRVVTEKDREDRTLLYYAVGRGNVEVVKELVAKGAKINEKDKYGKTPVRYAIDVGNVKVFQALLENIHEETVFSIVNQKDRDGTTLLHYAVGNGKAEVVKELVAKGAKVDEIDIFGKTPLQYAIEAGNVEVVKELVKGAKVDEIGIYGKTPLQYAIEARNVPVCMQLIDREAKFISEEDKVFGASLLKNAIKDNNYDVAIKLLEAGAKVDQKDEYGKTPLHYAAEAGNIVLCAKILEGYSDDVAAKVLTEGKKGERPLDILARTASLENKEELTKIAKHIGGILRESNHVLKNKTGLWQNLTDVFQSLCKEIGIKTDREKVKEILGVGKGKKVTVAAFRSALEKLSKKTSAAYTKPSAGAEKGNAAQR